MICSRDEDQSKLAIYLMTNSDGRPSGEAFIQVATEVDVEAACNKNNQLMGQRYIEGRYSNDLYFHAYMYLFTKYNGFSIPLKSRPVGKTP